MTDKPPAPPMPVPRRAHQMSRQELQTILVDAPKKIVFLANRRKPNPDLTPKPL